MHDPASSDAPRPSTPAGGAPQSTGTQYVADSEVHLLDRLAVLYRYRRLCVTVFVLTTSAMIIQGYTNVQMFQAQARLEINDERSTAVPGLQNDQNTYYEDPFKSAGKFDYVMANPPFNVNKVDKAKLETDPRFPFGLPTADNANYIWIQAFYSALSHTGRAGFVMANSAADASGSELEIRKKLMAESISNWRRIKSRCPEDVVALITRASQEC